MKLYLNGVEVPCSTVNIERSHTRKGCSVEAVIVDDKLVTDSSSWDGIEYRATQHEFAIDLKMNDVETERFMQQLFKHDIGEKDPNERLKLIEEIAVKAYRDDERLKLIEEIVGHRAALSRHGSWFRVRSAYNEQEVKDPEFIFRKGVFATCMHCLKDFEFRAWFQSAFWVRADWSTPCQDMKCNNCNKQLWPLDGWREANIARVLTGDFQAFNAMLMHPPRLK